MKNFNCN